MIVVGTLHSKLYIRDKYEGRFLSWAKKQLNPDYVEPSACTHLPLPPLPSSAPLVPSTPLPESIISGSPAWDPSSRTPGRPLGEEGGDQGPNDRHDTNFEPRRRIPKPAGRVNRKDGYSLKESLELDEAVYVEIKVSRMILVICFH
jgi:hypothetical protein